MEVDISQQMLETRQQLLENFDEDIHDLLKLQLDQTEQRLDKVSRWFWLLTQHQLKSYASFDEQQHRFHLSNSAIDQVSTGHYQLITRNNRQNLDAVNAHIYRMNHPLGEWVVDSAKNTATPSASYAAHGAKVTVIEALLGQSGVLKLQRFSIEALDRTEDHLLFAAITDDGQLLPAETAQKIMQLPAKNSQPQDIATNVQIESALTIAQYDIIKLVNNRNLVFLKKSISLTIGLMI